MIMAIDPGIAACGIAIGEKGKIIHTQTLRTYKKWGSMDYRVDIMYENIVQLIEKFNIEKVIIEDFDNYGKAYYNASKVERLIGQIKAYLKIKNIPYELITTKSWEKKYKNVELIVQISPRFEQIREVLEVVTPNKKDENFPKSDKAKYESEDHEFEAVKILIPEII